VKIAVLLPCYNEEAAIVQTVAGFRAALPDATIYVYDNNSSDRTVEVARGAGAIVRTERMQGKGNVVRRMFADVDADIYVMADGDATYEAAAAPALVARLVDEQLDMVVGARKSEIEEAYRRGHRLDADASIRAQFHRYPVGIPGILASVCEELPRTLGGFRD
jgi:glycosyltransferase involved in cell wall biosynthesis